MSIPSDFCKCNINSILIYQLNLTIMMKPGILKFVCFEQAGKQANLCVSTSKLILTQKTRAVARVASRAAVHNISSPET